MNPKTIKEIKQESVDNIILQMEHSFNDIKFIECEINKSLLPLLDEVDKRLPEEKSIQEQNCKDAFEYSENIGFNNCRQQVIKLLSDMREGK